MFFRIAVERNKIVIIINYHRCETYLVVKFLMVSNFPRNPFV